MFDDRALARFSSPWKKRGKKKEIKRGFLIFLCLDDIEIEYPNVWQEFEWTDCLPRSRSLTSRAARSPSALRSLSIFLDRSTASLSMFELTAQPMVVVQ